MSQQPSRERRQKRQAPPLGALAYTVNQTADALQTSRRSIYRMIAAGTLVAIRTRDSGAQRIPKWSIDQFLRQPRTARSAAAPQSDEGVRR
jgi:excisionase family DNA binding protein